MDLEPRLAVVLILAMLIIVVIGRFMINPYH